MLQINNETYLTTSEATDLTGYTESHIQKLAKAGKVTAVRIGKAWAIEKQSLLDFGTKSEPKKPKKKTHGNNELRLRLRAIHLGHKLYHSPDGRVYCTRCQLTVTQIKERCKA